MNILENKFYNEQPFLTAKKILDGRYLKTKEYIKEHNVKTCILTFCKDLETVLQSISNKVIKLDAFLKAGEDEHYVYAIGNIIFAVPFVGSATAAFEMEDLASIGIKNFIACGSAGLIDPTFDQSKFLVVKKAFRDEGTSYHYANENIEAKTSNSLTKTIENTLKKLNFPYEIGSVWTTDGFYRETPSSIEYSKSLGAKCVDMDCSAWCIVAEKLNLNFAQFLYFSDSVQENNWDFVGTTDSRIETKALITKIAYQVALNFKEEINGL